ncbi:MAG: HlyC/CorC family transporter [Verrucomicrobia bacterium]|nr:HlyC/CorC family transporter [Verrucomicrobiota bacterium]
MGADEILITVVQIAAVLALVLLNGFFVAAEFALVKVRDTQLEPLVSKGHRRARTARRIVHNLDAVLSATQLGITLASLALGWVGKPIFASLLAPVVNLLNIGPEQADWLAFAVGFTVITFLHIVAGEVAPKSLAIQKPLPTSLWVALPLHWFYKLFYPFIWVLNHAASWLLRRCGVEPVSEGELAHSDEELRLILARGRRHEGGPTLGQDITLNAFDLRHRRVRDVMHPRQEIVALDTEATIAECLALAERTRYSRFPLCESGSLDKTLGVVHFKDLVALRHEAKHGRDLGRVARKIIFVPEIARLEKLLSLFLERKLHFALVVDEYGGTVGMVTLENVLEELVGPIQDEFDQELPLVRQTGERAWELSGTLPLHKLGELTGENSADAGEAATLSGLVTHRLGRFPKVGDVLALGHCKLCVVETDGPRVAWLKLTHLANGLHATSLREGADPAEAAGGRSPSQTVTTPRS